MTIKEIKRIATGSNDGIPLICLDKSKDSLNLNEKLKDKDTEISFPDFKGWCVWCCSYTRYTVSICLVKNH